VVHERVARVRRTRVDVVRTSIVLTESLLEKLDILKKRLGAISRNEVIRWLIYEKYRRLRAEGRLK
jgi:metal-responsive CopG/Arc/MetJ family transcriptional regulator